MPALRKFLAAAALLFAGAAFLFACGARAQSQTGSFTQAEATAGRAAYLTSCASCHGADLGGGGSAADLEDSPPPLTGQVFRSDMGNQSVGALYTFVAASMPDDNPASLKPETYRAIVSYLLAANGAQPGTTPFNDKSDVRVGSIANGQLVPSLAAPPGGPPPPPPP